MDIEDLRRNTIIAVAKDLLGYVASDYLRMHLVISGENLENVMRNSFALAEKFVEYSENYDK